MILLDTHTLVWALRDTSNLSEIARQMIVQADGYSISAASLYEISLKGSRGKWPEVEDLLDQDIEDFLLSNGIEVIPVSGKIMQLAGGFDWQHRDPFDRIIVATALERQIPVVSKDKTLDTCGFPAFERVW